MVPRCRGRRYASGVTAIVGVDLAWSGRKPSGLCVLRERAGQLAFESLVCATLTGREVASWLGTLGPDVLAGIDAPLVAAAGRTAEAQMARMYGGRGVYAYSARPDFLERRGIAEGPLLGHALAASGWNLDPAALTGSAAGRHALEVFPHAATVSLFGGVRVLRYKKGPLAGRLGPMAELQRLLAGYVQAACPELLDSPLGTFLAEARSVMPGRAMKETEDRLDAIACALSAYHLWRHGLAGAQVFGDAASGYIAVPVAPA